MRVLVTSSHGPLAIIVDIATGQIVHEIPIPKEMHGARNRPFGITRDGNGLWYIASNAQIACLNTDFSLNYLMSGLPENIHQICFDHLSGELWVAATSVDSLLAINTQERTARRFNLVSDTWEELDAPGSDTQHFSSVRWYGSRLYVLAHKFGVELSQLTIYDRGMQRLGQWSIGREAHSICEYNGQIFILDSRGGMILGNRGKSIPVGEAYFYNPERKPATAGAAILDRYQDAQRHYSRGMAITPQGFAVVATFDFGRIETRDSGDVYLRVFDVASGERKKEIVLKGVGNIQDIHLYDQPLVNVPSDIAFYRPVIKELTLMIPEILDDKMNDPEIKIPYDENRAAPNFAATLPHLVEVPIDFAVRSNKKAVIKGVEENAQNVLNSILPGDWERSGGFWYPAASGWMDWHTNFEVPGPRIYLVWCAEGGKSRFIYSPDGGRTIVEKMEPPGWSCNVFMIGNERHLFWHAVDSGGTDRISFGFKPKSFLHQFAVA